MSYRKGAVAESSISDGLSGIDKKIVKIYKALRVMEKSKHLEPKFSDGLKPLAYYIASIKLGENSMNLSKISKTDFETSSNFTGIGGAFGSIFNKEDSVKQKDLGSIFSH